MQHTLIKCAFCNGTGENPYFRHPCPVCKGKGENQIMGKCKVCGDCHGSGHKGGTTLTCYTCTGLGVLPDIHDDLMQGQREIRKARRMMEEEKAK
jgi:DnaJ-class molecular chaperone